MAAVLMVLCGLPASGKTYLSDLLKKSNITQDMHIFHVCFDDHIPSNLNTKNNLLWKTYRRLVNKCVEQLIVQYLGNKTAIDSNMDDVVGVPTFNEFWLNFMKTQASRERTCCFSLSQNRWSYVPHVFIIDDNMFYRSMRHEYFLLARKYNLGYTQVFFDCPFETALKTNSLRINPVQTNTIISMAAKIEGPFPEKYPWELNTLKISQTNRMESRCTVEKVHNLIRKALDNPIPPLEEEHIELKEKSRTELLASLLYQTDQTLRKIISKQMKTSKDEGHSKDEIKNLAEAQNTKRKQILQDLKRTISTDPEIHNSDEQDIIDEIDFEHYLMLQLVTTPRDYYMNQCLKILKMFINKGQFDSVVQCIFKHYNHGNN